MHQGVCTIRRFSLLTLLLLPAAASAHSETTEESVERLFARPTITFDTALPEISFGAWFDEIVPNQSMRIFEIAQCTREIAGEQPNQCLVIEVRIISRHRTLNLEFESDSLAFRGGMISASEPEGKFAVTSLAALPKLLKRAMRPFPLTCPADTELKLRESYAGLFEWCEDANGVRHGPARSWFSTGIYLLDRGQYANGKKSGDWTECNRFERCRFNTYIDGVRQ